ncbi:MAG: Ig-like domain-containing protein [Coprobacter sp.]|nr:Ig-like domain-containing protein [Coprobacter sp.]
MRKNTFLWSLLMVVALIAMPLRAVAQTTDDGVAAGTTTTLAGWLFNADNNAAPADNQVAAHTGNGLLTFSATAGYTLKADAYPSNSLLLDAPGNSLLVLADCADAANHDNYAQYAFSTRRYKDVKLAFTFASDTNTNWFIAYSTDTCKTWTIVGEYKTDKAWFQAYTPDSVLLAKAGDKDSVVVRVINGVNGNGYSPFGTRIQALSFTGTKMAADEVFVEPEEPEVEPEEPETDTPTEEPEQPADDEEVAAGTTRTLAGWLFTTENNTLTEKTVAAHTGSGLLSFYGTKGYELNADDYPSFEGTGGSLAFKTTNNGSLVLADFADAANHDNYAQYVFSTAEYQDIKLAFTYACNAGSNHFIVYSTDSCKTWSPAAEVVTDQAWWQPYSADTVLLTGATNKDSVYVRILNGKNGEGHVTYDTRIKKVDFIGTKIATSGDFSIVWPFDEGKDAHVATRSDKLLFAYDMHATGSNVPYLDKATTNSINFTRFQPIANSKSPTEDDKITFTFKPQVGVTFTPTTVSLDGCRYGTSGGNLDIYLVCGDQRVNLVTGANPARNNETSSYTFDVTGITNTSEELTLEIYLYNLANNKQVGLANIKIAGTFEGIPASVPEYTFAIAQNIAEAGSIKQAPIGNKFNENTQIILEAVENFGYDFVNWTDAEGNVVAETPAYTHTLTADVELTANFKAVNTYALNLTVENSNDYYIQLSDEGTFVNGKRMYEEGAEISLTAWQNVVYTFLNWEDGTTETTRTIKMTADTDVTATFSNAPFICGWDFWNAGGANRMGDIFNESTNAGMLSLRTLDGTTKGALDRSALSNNPTYEGRYAWVNWGTIAQRYYYEVTISSKTYYNIRVLSKMLCSFNGYSIQFLQYSTDGENFTTADTIKITDAKKWIESEIKLPEAAENQEKLWIRWYPDYTSSLVGTLGDQDGTSICDIFILADQVLEDDFDAPLLRSTIPANEAGNASATGSIVLNFNEIVKAGEGNVTLNGEALTDVTYSGSSVLYRYHNLDYNTSYTVNVPAGALVDRSGNAFAGTSFSFTTMDRKQPEARIYDAVVAADGSGDYLNVVDAIAAAPAGRTAPWLIFIKEGYYKGHIEIPATKPYIYLIGQDKDKVTVTDDRLCGGDNAYHVSQGASVVINSANFYAENISFENEYGVQQNAGPQALAMYTNNDRAVFYNCKLRSYQDTYLTSTASDAHRHYLKDCFIEGAVDFIYGGGDVYFDECTINIVRPSGGYIVAPSHGPSTKWGYVFDHNVITAPTNPASATDIWLGRPWHNACKTVFLYTRAEVTIPAAGWYETMGTIPAIFADYKTTDAEGNLLDLSHRIDTYYYTSNGEKIYGKAKNYLTDEEAATYTYANVLTGSDYWNPRELMEAVDAPVVTYNAEKRLSWAAVPYAMCYVVSQNGKVVGFTAECTYTPASFAEGDEFTVQAANEYGSLGAASAPATYSESTAIDSVEVAATVVSTEIYTLSGMRVAEPVQGVNIVRMHMSDGSIVTTKVIVK